MAKTQTISNSKRPLGAQDADPVSANGGRVRMDTCQLDGEALNWAVAMATNKPVTIDDGHVYHCMHGKRAEAGMFSPINDWGTAGPLLEQYEVFPEKFTDERDKELVNKFFSNANGKCHVGKTPLIAALRMIVEKQIGSSLSVPAKLIKNNSQTSVNNQKNALY